MEVLHDKRHNGQYARFLHAVCCIHCLLESKSAAEQFQGLGKKLVFVFQFRNEIERNSKTNDILPPVKLSFTKDVQTVNCIGVHFNWFLVWKVRILTPLSKYLGIKPPKTEQQIQWHHKFSRNYESWEMSPEFKSCLWLVDSLPMTPRLQTFRPRWQTRVTKTVKTAIFLGWVLGWARGGRGLGEKSQRVIVVELSERLMTRCVGVQMVL